MSQIRFVKQSSTRSFWAAAFHTAGCPDPFEGPAQFVAAYHAVLPLTDAEQEVIADLMATRHLITALISEWRAVRYPENRAEWFNSLRCDSSWAMM